MDFRILGPVEARVEGRALDIAGSRQRALLALLLMRRGEPVSQDRLIEELWGERRAAGRREGAPGGRLATAAGTGGPRAGGS